MCAHLCKFLDLELLDQRIYTFLILAILPNFSLPKFCVFIRIEIVNEHSFLIFSAALDLIISYSMINDKWYL